MSLPAPSLLAQLPRPLANAGGKIQFGEAYGIQGSKKRKRHEITAAIDGEGVNIYNAQFPKLVASYAIPPQASHSCPPCSIRQKLPGNSGIKRQTYCAVETSGMEIKCFVDEMVSGRSTPNISTASFPIKDTASRPIFVGTIPTDSPSEKDSDTFDVIVVHQDGRIRRLSFDLKTERWTIRSESTWSSRELAACFTVGFEDARKFLFRKREDVVASVLGDGFGTDPSNSTILVLVAHTTSGAFQLNDVQVIFYSISAQSHTGKFQLQAPEPLKHLMTLNLPVHPSQDLLTAHNYHWSANFVPGELSLSSKSGFISFDITQFSPKVSSCVIIEDETFSSIMRISSHSIIAGGKSTLSVYDTHYQSLQASLPLAEVSKSASSKKQDATSSLEFISHFSKLDVLVAAYGSSLCSFDLASIHNERHVSRKRPRRSLLIDSIGKGITSGTSEKKTLAIKGPTMENVLSEERPTDQLNELKKELASVTNRSTFDAVVKAKLWGKSESSKDKGDSIPPGGAFIDPENIKFILTRMFKLKTIADRPTNDSAAVKLIAVLIPPMTFKWLVKSKQLNVANIENALRHSNGPHSLSKIPPGALIKALTSYDPSMKLLLTLLGGPGYLEATELAHALCELLNVARQQSNVSESSQKSVAEAAHVESPDNATSTTDNKEVPTPSLILVNAITGLNLALNKLHSHSLSYVTKSIRATLSNTDVLSIIHHLRYSLATGGHTSRFTEVPPAAFANSKFPSLSLSVIVDLLTACIDAVGPSGWISAAGFAGAAGSEASLIADMKSEVAATLTAIDEATYLKGILREFIRCCETSVQHSAAASKSQRAIGNGTPSKTHSAKLKRKEYHHGARILVYDVPEDSAALEGSDSKMLPLSLKISGPQSGVNNDELSKKKVYKSTGEIRSRSGREIAHNKHKAVGKYSFERIVI
ncbi:TPA_exp: Uncharacterized protein A8136_5145 [Trichophyton benhamiae CBS 112371]|uniref:Uncharacterized protein n=1 Tax=Arthroderma benhamiae (strain ATCC MYA-4681 / CBS 112371) TaxID=663331 RepID=D4B4C8_ARTBC|nr:uncharacterized protein ARB_03317 [Trichophyton benhamiae CBS 112371]EFE29976.1 conserved hypothetical protein [Trichophyton benhamiae CBS 112371]DAA73220.1 TPA_exp: Uncharacterized protein A8136_5145 [Trichophyton benhamiae CBS 112371]